MNFLKKTTCFLWIVFAGVAYGSENATLSKDNFLKAAEALNKELMQQELNKKNKNINIVDGEGNTALHLVVENVKNSEPDYKKILTCVKFLFDNNIQFYTNMYGKTPLFIAIEGLCDKKEPLSVDAKNILNLIASKAAKQPCKNFSGGEIETDQKEKVMAINVKNSDDSTPLFSLIFDLNEDGVSDIIKILLENGADFSEHYSKNEDTVFIAIFEKFLEIFNEEMKKEEKLRNHTPLINIFNNTIKILIEKANGIKINGTASLLINSSESIEKKTALHYLVELFAGGIGWYGAVSGCIKTLIKYGADPLCLDSDDNLPYDRAKKIFTEKKINDSHAILQCLKPKEDDQFSKDLLFREARYLNLNGMKKELDKKNSNVNVQNSLMETVLHVVIKQLHEGSKNYDEIKNIVNCLIETYSADVAIQDERKKTLINLACEQVKESSQTASLSSQNLINRNKNIVVIIKKLIDSGGKEGINENNAENMAPIHTITETLCSTKSDSDVLQSVLEIFTLVAKNAKVNAFSNCKTALYMLIDHFDANGLHDLKDPIDKNAPIVIKSNAVVEAVKILIKNGGDPTLGYSFYICPILLLNNKIEKLDNKKVFENIVFAILPKENDKDFNKNVLFWAVKNLDIEAVKRELAKQGSDVNAENDYDETALVMVIKEMRRQRLDEQVSELPDSEVCNKILEIVNFLVEQKNINMNPKTKNGFTEASIIFVVFNIMTYFNDSWVKQDDYFYKFICTLIDILLSKGTVVKSDDDREMLFFVLSQKIQKGLSLENLVNFLDIFFKNKRVGINDALDTSNDTFLHKLVKYYVRDNISLKERSLLRLIITKFIQEYGADINKKNDKKEIPLYSNMGFLQQYMKFANNEKSEHENLLKILTPSEKIEEAQIKINEPIDPLSQSLLLLKAKLVGLAVALH